MALRDHSLDEKITNAAREEFSKKGFTGASLRKIAEKAGVTVGAIQTRYKTKDELFVCLLKPFLDEIGVLFQTTGKDYDAGAGAGTDFLEELKASMRHESAAILHLIFDRYEDAVLLLCRSAGSSLEHFFDRIVQSKIKKSIAFFRRAGFADIDEKLLGFLISVQFDSYRRIVLECADRRSAEAYLASLMTYHFGGWTAFFELVDPLREDVQDEV